MTEYKIKICEYAKKDTFIIKANSETEAKKLALKEYDKLSKYYSFNIREVGVNGD